MKNVSDVAVREGLAGRTTVAGVDIRHDEVKSISVVPIIMRG
jgi:hypothetical protein